MNRTMINYVNDLVIGILFAAVFVTGLIKLPGLQLHRLGFPMAGITFIHDWAGVLMGVLIAVHIILHWKWITCMTKSIFRKKGDGTKCEK